MALAPSNIISNTAYLEWTGGQYKIWMNFIWTENETGNCHYLIEAQRMDNVTWDQVGDVDAGVGFQRVQVGTHGPPGWGYTQIYNRIRITCSLIPTDPSPGVLEATFTFFTSRFRTTLVNIVNRVAFDQYFGGTITFFADDNSYYIYCANVHAYNMSQGQREIYHRDLAEGDAALAVNYCNHSEISIGFNIQPGDISLGDRIQIHYTAIVGNGHYPNNLDAANDGIVTIWTFTYTIPVNFPFLSLEATQGTSFAYDVEQAPGITGTPYLATFSATGLPPGLTIASDGWITGIPTTVGTWNFHVTTVDELGDIGGGDVQIIVGVSQIPVITGPTGPFNLNQYVPMSFQLTATKNPTSFAVASGTLPPGLTLDTTTGIVSGSPTAIQSATSVGFTASNGIGTSPVFTINIAVIALPLPVVTSPSTATAYRGESFNYQITATNFPIAFTATPLPTDLAFNAQTGVISGTLNPTNQHGTLIIHLRAQNQTGYSAPFILTLTIADRIPVIVSNLSDETIAFQQYTYQIVATGYPVTYGAANLPFGLVVDILTGVISGEPIIRGTFNITISATNSAGTGTAVLVLIVKLERPVIDTSITSGKAITCETGIPILFQPVASNSPTFWVYAPLLDYLGFSFTAATGQLSGTFATVGLYGEVFFAGNAGGLSDPAIFYFLVEQGVTGTVAALGSGLDIWIDIQDGSVSIMLPGSTMDQTTTTTSNGTTTVSKKTVTVPTDAPILWSKRGDTLPLTIRFHKNGKPVIITGITSLIFGVREDFTLPYATLYEGVNINDDGSYAIYPSYANNPEIDFEIDDTEEFLELLAEVQWEVNNIGDVTFARRSSQTFTNRIYRDVINPDDPSPPS